MNITAVTATAESTPRPHPHRDAIQWLDTRGTTRVSITTDEGIAGASDISFGF
jgi:L-alanine-DL-glutamate epimerase-like enolase superfamily enzyme